MVTRVALKKIFEDIFNIDNNLSDDYVNVTNIKDWDSINHLNLIISIESKFNIDISPEDFQYLYSDFETILKYICSKKNING